MSAVAKAQTRRRASIGARRNPESEMAVLAAARAVLDENGYTGFSIEEVARRAGAGKRTIYRWWPTKTDLFMAIYGPDKDAVVNTPNTGDLARDLAEYTISLWTFWRTGSSGDAFRALIAEAQGSPAALDALRNRFLPERLAFVRAVFEKAVARGEIQADGVDLRVQLWVGFSWFRLLTGQIEEDRDLITRTIRMLTSSDTP